MTHTEFDTLKNKLAVMPSEALAAFIAELAVTSETVLRAQKASIQKLEFLIREGQFLAQFESQLNPRQIKVVKRLFQAGPDGFIGGLSAENYLAMTKTSRATATRDLQGLAQKGALTRTGERKHTRYWLKLDSLPT